MVEEMMQHHEVMGMTRFDVLICIYKFDANLFDDMLILYSILFGV